MFDARTFTNRYHISGYPSHVKHAKHVVTKMRDDIWMHDGICLECGLSDTTVLPIFFGLSVVVTLILWVSR